MPLNPNIIMAGNALNFQPSVNKSNAIANQNAFVDTQSKRQGMDRVAGEMRQAEADNFVGNLKKAAGILSSSRNPEEYQALLTEGVRLGMVNNEQAASWGQVEWSPENMADIANQGRNLEDIMSERAATETARVKTDVDINTATALSDRAVTADTVASDRAVTAADIKAKALKRSDDLTLAATGAKTNIQKVKVELDMQKTYEAQSKVFRGESRATRTVMTALDTASESAPATLAAGTAFMKLLDPGSVVRESELAQALAATGAFDRAGNLIKVFKEGKVMTPPQAEQFRAIVERLYRGAEKAQRKRDEQFTAAANRHGLDSKNIVWGINYLDDDVFGSGPTATATSPPGTQPVIDIDTMSGEQINALTDEQLDALSEEQHDALQARFGGGE